MLKHHEKHIAALVVFVDNNQDDDDIKNWVRSQGWAKIEKKILYAASQ